VPVGQVAIVVIHLKKGDGFVKDEVLQRQYLKFIVYDISTPQI
jgi:hypothetical protein